MAIESVLLLLFSVLGIFTAIILITRIFGLRTFAKMSSFDFASTIAVGSILAAIILNENQSLSKGVLALFFVIGYQTLFSFAIRKSDWFKSLFTNNPKILMWDGKIIYENLSECNVSEGDLIAKLREANVLQFSNVKAVIFENTGDISVLHGEGDIDIDERLLKDVELNELK